MTDDSSVQPIVRLTPLSSVLAAVEAHVGAVPPTRCRLAAACGRTLAEDVVAAELPPRPIALRDGFAVEAAILADAGPYAPLQFAVLPARVDAGDEMPDGTDAVVPFDAITRRGDRAEVTAAVVPGDGVLPAGGDTASGALLRRAGRRVSGIDCALIAGARINEVAIRAPRIRIAYGARTRTPEAENAFAMLCYAVGADGGTADDRASAPQSLDDALTDEKVHAVIVVGGTGSGRNGSGVAALARLGRVEAHGIAVSPGEMGAFGFVGPRPVLVVPERLDAVLAAWLLIGRPLLAKLAGRHVEDAPVEHRLKRKIASALGLTELIPVHCSGGMAEPLASGYLSIGVLARSDGWVVVPADSEGFAAGTVIAVRSWP